MTPTPNPFQRPSKPQTSQSPAFARTTNPNSPKKVIQTRSQSNSNGGGNQGRGGGGNGGNGGGNNPPQPSPWLNPECEPNPCNNASFVEYLRWMREFNNETKKDKEISNITKIQILQLATEQDNCNYNDHLEKINKRTKLIAGKDNTFQVKCPWRIRVGGHRGPESILLPAFDALGIPYIPSSTLRGVARNQAIREIMAEISCNWEEAEKQIAPYFGSLEADKENQAGKIIFLDAYPLPNQHGLAIDMANNIWKWENNNLKYDPNPNPFLSLKESTFLIGLRLASGCKDQKVLEQVKQWLIKGLQSGIGSQVNTGYGKLIKAGIGQPKTDEFFRVEFTLEGQLIHGSQKLNNVYKPFKQDKNGNLKPDTSSVVEVRPTAFKSMLRYWFRAFALGFLSTNQVQDWEAKLFGGITNPNKQRGWVEFDILQGINSPETKENPGKQEGILILSYSSESELKEREKIANLFKNLTWMMFNLGGIGQGARRPCYSRVNRPNPRPPYRGSTFYLENEDDFWNLPENIKEFQQLFQRRLKDFYTALSELISTNINFQKLRRIGVIQPDQWTELVDANCRIIVCSGDEDFGKPYALSILHSDQLNPNKDRHGNKIYESNLCGNSNAKPSPVWIADLENYQVVTVFGATQNPRLKYLEELHSQTSNKNYIQIFPLDLRI